MKRVLRTFVTPSGLGRLCVEVGLGGDFEGRKE